jgi:hypothetical protein
MTKNGKELEIFFFLIFLIKNCNLLIPRPPSRTSKVQEKPSALKRGHPALQKIKFSNFFLFLWVIFAFLDPNPETPLNSDSIRIRIHNTAGKCWNTSLLGRTFNQGFGSPLI